MRLSRHLDLVRRPWRPLYTAPEVRTARLETFTDDGVRLSIHRLRLPGSHKPLLMLHGLAANRLAYNFPGRSLSEWLARRGFDCFMIELRGAGESEHPKKPWDLDDHLNLDLPAAVRAVQEATGQTRLPWIGHSMGGLLWLCYAMLHGEAALDRGITIASALDYRVGESGFRSLLPLLPWIRRMKWVPFGEVVHWLAPMLGRAPDRLTTFNVWPPNIEPDVVRRLHATGFHAIPIRLLDGLATAFSARGLSDRRGEVSFLERAAEMHLPVMLLAGTRDVQAPVAAVERTAALLGGPTELRLFGRAHGQREDYGHWDLLIGQNAVTEVWPELVMWLDSETVALRRSAPSVGAEG